jgi:hypothetical protein
MTADEERRLKMLLKDAVTEVLEERQDILRAAVQESLEDAAMLRAIQAGENCRPVSAIKYSNASPGPRENRLPRIFRFGLVRDHRCGAVAADQKDY